MTMHEITILAAERVRLPDGREFTGLNCETDACRALIADGCDPAERVQFVWHHGERSLFGPISAFARWRYTEDGRARWKPHPMAQLTPHLRDWAATVAEEAKRVRGVEP